LSVRRYRRSLRYDVGAGALVLLMVVVAAVGVYAVVLAAVTFVAWLLRVAIAGCPHGLSSRIPS